MNFGAHPLTQRGIDELVTLDQPLAFKLCADDGGKKVLAVALDFEVLARQAGFDVLLELFGCGQHSHPFSCKTLG